MDRAFLSAARRDAVALAVACLALLLGGCRGLFDDTLAELDPSLRDSSLTALPAAEHFAVTRGHLLESFGSFGCVSCPGAEDRLIPYLHPEIGGAAYDSQLVIVNYHVKFGSITDPWVLPAGQAVNDAYGFTSLPQVVMDGSNSAYGIREKDADFSKGDYDTLVARMRRNTNVTLLDLRLDTASFAYDSARALASFRFRVLNRDEAATGPLALRALFAKNRAVTIPIYAHPWETIVTAVVDADSSGHAMALASLPALSAKAFTVSAPLPPEGPKHVVPPPGGPENPGGYALILVVKDEKGVVVNTSAYHFHPVLPGKN